MFNVSLSFSLVFFSKLSQRIVFFLILFDHRLLTIDWDKNNSTVVNFEEMPEYRII